MERDYIEVLSRAQDAIQDNLFNGKVTYGHMLIYDGYYQGHVFSSTTSEYNDNGEIEIGILFIGIMGSIDKTVKITKPLINHLIQIAIITNAKYVIADNPLKVMRTILNNYGFVDIIKGYNKPSYYDVSKGLIK